MHARLSALCRALVDDLGSVSYEAPLRQALLATTANDQRAELATYTVVGPLLTMTKLPNMLPPKLRFLPIALVAGFSGFCSLVYQVTWDRTVRFNFGGDPVSSAIVTSSFLLGLGIGAVAFGS